MSTIASRRAMHSAINNLSYHAVAQIVRTKHPNVPLRELNALAKQVVAQAHALVSPKGKR